MRWEKRTLGELTASTRPICYGVLKPGGFIDDGIPLVRVTDISKNHFDSTNLYRISASLDEEFVRSRIEGGEILLSIQGTVGRVAIAPPEMKGANISRTIAIISPDERVNRQYLYHYLRRLGDASGFYISGTTRASLNISELRSIEIPLPPLEEQRRIAAILDKVVVLIESAAQAFCLSQDLKKALVLESLGPTKEGDERARLKVRDVADMITGYPFKSAQYTDKAQHTRLCRGINVLPDRIEWKQVARWPEITPELRSYHIDQDDILIAMDRPWITEGLKIARAKPTDVPSLLVQRVARIRVGSQILPRILFEILSSKSFATHCTPTETTVPQISPIEIREYEFELPCLKEQKRIDSILAGIEKSQVAMNRRAHLLKEKLCTLSRSYFN